jgi:hypothetical protein
MTEAEGRAAPGGGGAGRGRNAGFASGTLPFGADDLRIAAPAWLAKGLATAKQLFESRG